MIRLIQYPQTDCTDSLKKQIIALQCTVWPIDPSSKLEDIIWPGNSETHVTSFALIDGSIAIGHIAIVGKTISHRGQTYNAFGLSEVVTHPSYQRKGYGLQLIREASAFIENCSPDICIFTCKPDLINFYTRGGWEHIKNTCLVGGTHEKPFRSDNLGLVTMMRFYSDKAKGNRQDFENSDIYLELKEKQLW